MYLTGKPMRLTRTLTPQQFMAGRRPEVLDVYNWRWGQSRRGIILRERRTLNAGDLVVCRVERPDIKWVMSADYLAENYK